MLSTTRLSNDLKRHWVQQKANITILQHNNIWTNQKTKLFGVLLCR